MSLMNYRSLVSKMTLLKIISVILVLGGCASQPSYYQPQDQPVTPEPVVMDQLTSVSNIEVEELGNSIRVIINGSEPLTYNVTQMEFPLRFVVDVAGAQLDAPSEDIPVDKGVITEIISSEIEKDGETTTRIEIGLNTYTAHYEVLPLGNALLIDFLRPRFIKKADNVIDFAISDDRDFVRVDILADGTIEDYNSFDLDEPTRLILDFPGLKTLLTVKEKESSSSLLKKVRCREHPDYFRVVLDFPMTDLPPFQVVPTTKGMAVFLGSGFEEKKAELTAIASSSPVTKEQGPPAPTETEEAEFQPEGKESPTLMLKAEKMENEEEESNDPSAETAPLESGSEASSPGTTTDESSPAEPVQPQEETSKPSHEMAEEAPEEQQTLEETPSEEPQPLIDFLRPRFIKKADNIIDLAISDDRDFVRVDI
ncbi:MAG: AMIN domain-containing protein, partial [Deltaproteobacteria bacterium]|nr:AMIN domain-containing protein [Deltaproteobacteria bacterium]